MEGESSVKRLEALWVSSRRVDLILLLALRPWNGWGISLVATTGQDGCRTFSHPINFGALSLELALAYSVPWELLQQKGS